MAVTTRSGQVDANKYLYLDPDEPYGGTRGRAIETERVVYFVPDNGSLPDQGNPQVIFSPSQAQNVSVAPNGYAVVGSGTLDTATTPNVLRNITYTAR